MIALGSSALHLPKELESADHLNLALALFLGS
jgi:hypothetical protein